MPEYHVASLPVFIATVRRFCAAWPENIRDTDTDQPIEMDHQAKALEVKFLQLICDEAERLLAQQALDELTPAQLRELIGQLRQFYGRVVVSTTVGEANGQTILQTTIETNRFAYPIRAEWDANRHPPRTYLCAGISAEGEAAQDLTEGPVTHRTWRQILTGIVAAELSHTLVVSASGTAPEITIAGEAARLLSRQAQAAGLTVEQYLNVKLQMPD